jgi:hypothetical protein
LSIKSPILIQTSIKYIYILNQRELLYKTRPKKVKKLLGGQIPPLIGHTPFSKNIRAVSHKYSILIRSKSAKFIFQIELKIFFLIFF